MGCDLCLDWVALAAVCLAAARLALAGLVTNQGSAAHSLGTILGTLDVDSLAADLGERWLTAQGYLKQHSSCSYTHPAVDLVHALADGGGWQRVEDIAAVRVRTHSLAEPLFRRHPDSRLAAMFSLPFVVSTAVVSGRVAVSTAAELAVIAPVRRRRLWCQSRDTYFPENVSLIRNRPQKHPE